MATTDPANPAGQPTVSNVPPDQCRLPNPGPGPAPYADGSAQPPPGNSALNGCLLQAYDHDRAQADLDSALDRYRNDVARPEKTLMFQVQISPRSPDAGPELILDDSNLLPFDFLRKGDRLGRAVVKLQRPDNASGTGFLVAPDLLLTNHHVLPTADIARATRAYANYEPHPPADPAGRAAQVELQPDAFFATSPDLDFTFCGVAGLSHLGTIPLGRDSLIIVPADLVNIIQHPRGRHKEVAIQDNRVAAVDNLILQYHCDTEPGSSGSPVFNNQWQLVALHHASVNVDHPGGRPALGLNPDSRYLNEGVRISAIALWLETTEAEHQLGLPTAWRLRGLFQGLDPQIGYFGALGRHLPGRSGLDAIVECYHARTDLLDVAFWDLPLTADQLREHLETLGGFLARAGIDVWFLAGCTPEALNALGEHLGRSFRLDYQTFEGRCEGGRALGILVRDTLAASAEWIAPEDGPAHLSLKAPGGSRRKSRWIQITAICRSPQQPGRQYRLETVLKNTAVRPDCDLLLLGDGFKARNLTTLAATHPTLRAAFNDDGGLAFLATHGSAIDRVYVTRNLALTFGSSHGLIVTNDRTWPQSIASISVGEPLALRLIASTRRSPARRSRTDPPRPGLGSSPHACASDPDRYRLERSRRSSQARPAIDHPAPPRSAPD